MQKGVRKGSKKGRQDWVWLVYHSYGNDSDIPLFFLVFFLPDFCKAFDTVPRSVLINKIMNYGLEGCTVTRVKSWLSSQAQRVVAQHHHCSPYIPDIHQQQDCQNTYVAGGQEGSPTATSRPSPVSVLLTKQLGLLSLFILVSSSSGPGWGHRIITIIMSELSSLETSRPG